MSKSPQRRFDRGGCAFVLITCLATLMLLMVNNAIVDTSYEWLLPHAPDWLKQRVSAQFILFVGPILLLFVQWWVIEKIRDLLGARRVS